MHSIYKQKNLPYLAVKVCPKCNEFVKTEENLCPNCAFNFLLKEEEKVQSNNKSQYAKDHAIASKNYVYNTKFEEKFDDFETAALSVKDLDKEDVLICEKCGAKVIGRQKYCGGCGAKVTKRKCPACQGLIDSKLAFCPLCGEKVQEYSNIEKSEEDVSDMLINFQDTSALNLESIHKKSKETPIVKVEEEILEPVNINMARKRTFVIMQMVVCLLVLVALLFSPILAPTFKGMFSQTNDTLIKGKELIAFAFTSIFSKSFDLTSISSLLTSGQHYIFASLPLIKNLVGESGLLVSFIITSLVYFITLVSIIIVLIASIVGLSKKTPFKGISLCILVICLAVGCLLIYPNVFTEAFLNYETWLLYAFTLVFILWFVIKLVFFKENALYKKANKKK